MESLEFHCCHLQGLKHRLQRFEMNCSVGSDPPGGGRGEHCGWWAVGGRPRIIVRTAGGTLRRFTSSHNSRVSKGAGGSPGPCLPKALWFRGTISSQSPRCTLHTAQRRQDIFFNLKFKIPLKKKYIYIYIWNGASLVAQLVKNLPVMQETWVEPLDWEDPLEKGMATHSSILAWKIPWTEEPGGL